MLSSQIFKAFFKRNGILDGFAEFSVADGELVGKHCSNEKIECHRKVGCSDYVEMNDHIQSSQERTILWSGKTRVLIGANAISIAFSLLE